MKRTIFLILAITFYFLANAKKPVTPDNLKKTAPVEQKTEIKAPDTTTLVVTDSAASVQEYLAAVQTWVNTCGKDAQALLAAGKALGQDVTSIFKGLPLPTTQEGLKQWTDRIDWLFGSFGSVAVMLLTWLASLFKKDPQGSINKIQEIFNKVRTRYLLFGSSVVVSIFALIKYNQDGIQLMDIVNTVGIALGVTIGGLGIQGFLEMLGIKAFKAKKV